MMNSLLEDRKRNARRHTTARRSPCGRRNGKAGGVRMSGGLFNARASAPLGMETSKRNRMLVLHVGELPDEYGAHPCLRSADVIPDFLLRHSGLHEVGNQVF